MSVVSRSVAGSAVAGSVRIPGRYRTPIPRTLLVVAVLVVAAVASLTAFIGAPVLMVLVLRLSTGARGAKKGRMGSKAQAHDESGPAHVSEHGPHRAQRPVARGSSGSTGVSGL